MPGLDLGVVVPGCLGLLGALCFSPSLNGSFVFDDSEAVVNNKDVRPSTPISNLLKNDFWGTPLIHNSSHKSYRPLTVASFRWNVWLNNGLLDPFGFHLLNLILHGVCTALTYFLFRQMFLEKREFKSAVSSLLFAVHPIHTEAVAGIVGRADLLCAIFFFLSVLLYIRATRESNLFSTLVKTILSSIMAGLAVLSKEQGITVIGICSAYDILVENHMDPFLIFNPTQWIKTQVEVVPSPERHSLLTNKGSVHRMAFRLCILFASGFLFVFLRYWVMDFKAPRFTPADNPASFADDWLVRVVNYNYIYFLNLWLLLCPDWLCFDWSMGCIPLISFNSKTPDFRLVFVLLLWVFFALLLYTYFDSRKSHLGPELAMAVSFMVIPFIIASNLFVRVGFVIAERVLYLPSVGYCMLLALGINLLAQRWNQKLVYSGLSFLVLVNVLRCQYRSYQWTSEAELFSSGLKVCPNNAKIHYNIAKSVRNDTLAVNHYREAIRLHPDYEQAMNNLANLLRHSGNTQEAETWLRKALSVRKEFPAAWMNLGIVLGNMNKFDEALQCYKNALSYRKDYPHCYYNLGNLKKYDLAYSSWKLATKQDPKHRTAWNNMIVMLDSIGKLDEAVAVSFEALSHLPNDSQVHLNLANALGMLSRFEEAEEHFLAAIHLNPNQPVYHTNLGVLYHRWKKYELAEAEYLTALDLNPNLSNVRKNLLAVKRLKEKNLLVDQKTS